MRGHFPLGAVEDVYTTTEPLLSVGSFMLGAHTLTPDPATAKANLYIYTQKRLQHNSQRG